jgi:hypothetical protein
MINNSYESSMEEKFTSQALRLTNKHIQENCPSSSLEPLLDHGLNPFLLLALQYIGCHYKSLIPPPRESNPSVLPKIATVT